MTFGKSFENKFVKQALDENRTIEETLGIGWELLKLIPKTEIKRIKDEFIEKYLPGEEIKNEKNADENLSD
jgi:V/A-type H+-transporting ATPase subunit B